MIGRIVSVKMHKSAVVLVENPKRHPLYGKQFMRTKRYLVDDPMGAKDGDVVEFVKVRPISKNKHFQIKKIIGSDIVSLETAQLQAGATEAIAEVLPEKEENPSTQVAQALGSEAQVFDSEVVQTRGARRDNKSEDVVNGKENKAEEKKVGKSKKVRKNPSTTSTSLSTSNAQDGGEIK